MIIIMGPAGAGKSVQGNLLAEKLGFEWVSTGDYLRSHITKDRKAQMAAGALISDQEIIGIISDFLSQAPDKNKLIIDGFPRTIEQARWLVSQHKEGKLAIRAVLQMEVSKEVAKNRLLGRGRDDDKEEVVNKRHDDYEVVTKPIIDWFKDEGVTVHEIDANGSVQQINQSILDKIGA